MSEVINGLGNVTANSDLNNLTDLNDKHIDEELIEILRPKLTAQKDAMHSTVKDNDGDSAYWYGFRDLDPDDEGVITEGEEPDGAELAPFERKAAVIQYGKPLKVTDRLLKHSKVANLMTIAKDKLTSWAARRMNIITYNAMINQTLTVIGGNGETITSTLSGAWTDNSATVAIANSSMTSSDYITETELETAYVTLQTRNAEKFPDGLYHMQVDACGESDLRQLDAWVDVSKYQKGEQLETNEIGRIKGFKVFAGGDMPTTTVNSIECHNFFCYGQDAYGTVDVEGQRGAPEIITNDLGYNDAMKLKGAIAVKFEFAATILCDTAATVADPSSQKIVRIVAPSRMTDII